MTQNKTVLAVVGTILLIISYPITCKVSEWNTKRNLVTEEKHEAKVDTAKIWQQRLDLALQNKSSDSILTFNKVKVLNEQIKATTSNEIRLKLKISRLNDSINKLNNNQADNEIKNFEAKDTLGTLKILKFAKVKDSLHIEDSIKIAKQGQIITLDSVSLKDYSNTLKTCLEANKSKEAVIVDEPKKHPLRDEFKKAYIWCITSVAVIESAILYLKK